MNIKSPKVSVIMTSYNAADYILESIESIINQSYADWELILVENGSKDGTDKIIKKINDKRFKILYLKENIGRTSALNLALKNASGNYIAVLDADDIADTDRLINQINFLEENESIGLLASWAEVIDENSKKIGQLKPSLNSNEINEQLTWTNPIVHSSVMYRRELAVKVGGYPKRMIWCQDYGLYISLAKVTQLHIEPFFHVKWRLNPNGMSTSSASKILKYKELLLNYRRSSRILSVSNKSRSMSKASEAILLINISRIFLIYGHYSSFKKYFIKGVLKLNFKYVLMRLFYFLF